MSNFRCLVLHVKPSAQPVADATQELDNLNWTHRFNFPSCERWTNNNEELSRIRGIFQSVPSLHFKRFIRGCSKASVWHRTTLSWIPTLITKKESRLQLQGERITVQHVDTNDLPSTASPNSFLSVIFPGWQPVPPSPPPAVEAAAVPAACYHEARDLC